MKKIRKDIYPRRGLSLPHHTNAFTKPQKIENKSTGNYQKRREKKIWTQKWEQGLKPGNYKSEHRKLETWERGQGSKPAPERFFLPHTVPIPKTREQSLY